MPRDIEYLIDILEAARLAIGYVAGQSKGDFLENTQCQDAVIRRLEVVGEAARRISEQMRATYPQLPWNAMIGMRNVMIHEYDDIDLSIVWDTVQVDLPTLVARLEEIVPPPEGEGLTGKSGV